MLVAKALIGLGFAAKLGWTVVDYCVTTGGLRGTTRSASE